MNQDALDELHDLREQIATQERYIAHLEERLQGSERSREELWKQFDDCRRELHTLKAK